MIFDACGLRWRHLNRNVPFAEVVISEVERNRSFKMTGFFAERIGQTGESAAMHSQGVILLFNVRGR